MRQRLSYDPEVATATTPSSQFEAGASKASLSEVQLYKQKRQIDPVQLCTVVATPQDNTIYVLMSTWYHLSFKIYLKYSYSVEFHINNLLCYVAQD